MSLRGGSVSGKVNSVTNYNPGNSRTNAAPAGPTNGNKGAKGKGTALISLDELDRIRAQVTKTNEDAYTLQRNADRKSLQEVSKGRVKNWPNTMEALRLKREEDRIKRLEDEEIERRRVDAEEQAHQDELRRLQIEKANKHMHDQQDMVKALRSKMLLCDVAYEQQAQKALMDRKRQQDRELEKHWEDVERQKMKEYDEKMQTKLEAEYKLKMDNAQAINDQLEQFKLNYIKQLKEEMLEGELIKRQVEEDLEREKLKELAKQKKIAEMRADLAATNQSQAKQKEVLAQQEVQDDMRIEEFRKKRDALDQMKKDREEQRFKDKQAERQRLIDRQIGELRAIKDNQENVLNKQVAEAEDKANRLFEEQQRRKLEMKQAIERSRQLQIHRKQREKDSAKQEEKEFADFWRIRNEELSLAEQQEKEEERQRKVEMQNFIKRQVQVKNDKAVNAFAEEQEQSMKAQALLDQQEKNFYSYAERCIKEWQDAGKNVKPLVMELKNYKKRIV